MRRLLTGPTGLLFVGALAVLVSVGATLTITGGLPDGLQDPLANAASHIGVDLPGGGDEDARSVVVSERLKHAPKTAGTAFNAPPAYSSDQGRETGGSAYRTGEYEDYRDRYYGEYFGYEEEDEDDEPAARYVAPDEDEDEDGAVGGEPGEPGEAGIPEGDEEGDEGAGEGGEGGPGGGPG